MSATRVAHRYLRAKTFTLNVGDPVLYGKYKNMRGTITGFGTNEKGDPTVTIEPFPPSRKQDRELKVFTLRYDSSREPAVPQVPPVTPSEGAPKVASQLPIMDPAYNIREVCKQLLLLEDHLIHPQKRCPDCIRKHLLTAEALAEEAVSLDTSRRFVDLLGGLAEKIRILWRAAHGGMDLSDVAQGARLLRKNLVPIAVMAKVGSSKTGCIVAAGEWDGHRCLFKNRDRNYTPEIRLYHEILDGLEVLYLKDEVTGWCEGLNEKGIGIVNAALAVAQDEKEGDIAKGKAKGKALKDGERVLRALQCPTIEEAIEALQNHKGGLKGHTFVSSPEETYSLEATWRGHDYHVRKLNPAQKHVRTNHGQFHQDAGYTEEHGDRYLSSLARRDQAMKVLRQVDGPKDIAPAIYGKRKGELDDPLNMVKLTEDMRTTSQMVLDLTDLVAYLYLIPGQVKYLGCKSNLPKGYKPKLTLKVFEYTDIDGDGEFDVVRQRKSAAGRVAAKYQKKKEVPKADGSGTTTVYEYSERQVQNRQRDKAERIEKLRKQMTDLRAQVGKDLTAKDPKKRLTALAVALMDETYERVGNEDSAEENGHYGVTTWLVSHVSLGKGKATIKYTGKSGVDHEKEVTTSKVLEALRAAIKGKGKDDKILCEGDECVVLAKDVNEYLEPYDVTAKDIRGLHANEEMKARLKEVRSKGGKLPDDKKEREKKLKAEFKKALEGAAEAVGHEASTLKSQYLVPGMEDAFVADGTVMDKLDKKATKSEGEKQDEEADRLVRPSPKVKPPRGDLRRRRIETDDDPDLDSKDKDLSMNYKDIGASLRVASRWEVREMFRQFCAEEKSLEERAKTQGEADFDSYRKEHAETDMDVGYFVEKALKRLKKQEEKAKAKAEKEEKDKAEKEEKAKAPKKQVPSKLIDPKTNKPMMVDAPDEAPSEEEKAKAEKDKADEEAKDKAEAEAEAAADKEETEQAEAKAKAKAVAKAVDDAEATVKSLLKADALPKESREKLTEMLSGMKRSEREAFGKSYAESLETLKDKPPGVKASREALNAEIPKDPKEAAAAVAAAHYADRVTFNPEFLGDVGAFSKADAKPDDLLDDAVAKKRSEAAYVGAGKLTPEDAQLVADRLDADVDLDSPRGKEVQGVYDALTLAAIVNGKEPPDPPKGSKLKKLPESPQFSLLAQALKKSGNDPKVLLGTTADLVNSKESVRQAVTMMSDADIAEFVKDGPLKGVAERLSDPNLGEGARSRLRAMLESQITDNVGLFEPMVAALGKGEKDEKVKKARKAIEDADKDPKVKSALAAYLAAEEGAAEEPKAPKSKSALELAAEAFRKARIVAVVTLLSVQNPEPPKHPAWAQAYAVRDEDSLAVLNQRVVKGVSARYRLKMSLQPTTSME